MPSLVTRRRAPRHSARTALWQVLLPRGGTEFAGVAGFLKVNWPALSSAQPQVEILTVERIQNNKQRQQYSLFCMALKMPETSSVQETAPASSWRDIAANVQPGERVWLFHGTSQATVPKIIAQACARTFSDCLPTPPHAAEPRVSDCRQGFNRSYCGKNAVAFGQGVYFARDAE